MSILKISSILLAILVSSGCHLQKKTADVVVGHIAGPETELVEVAKQVAKQQYQLEVKIVEFSDYNLPNEALADGSLDMNIYQHLPYLQSSIAARGYPLSVMGKTFIYPMGIYSNHYKNLTEIPDAAVISIPNDSSNQTRALRVLQSAGLIRLTEKNTLGVGDIVSNPKHLKIKELDAAQLPRLLPDVDAAVINTTFAIPAGLNPAQDALFLETKDSPYANIIVIRKDSANDPRMKQLVEALQSEPVQKAAKRIFNNQAIPAW